MAVEATKSSTKPTIQATGTGKAPGRGANCSENVALSAVPPEPVSASLPDTADEDAGDEEEEDTPLTPPTSEAKGPAASRQAPAKKVSAKSASALKPATQAKQAPKRVKKGVTGAKNEGVKADGRPANNMKGNGKARSDSANAKANPAQVDAAKQGAPPKVEGQEHLIMDPAVFSTSIFDIFIGHQKAHYMAHEAVLSQSPLLARLIQTQSTKKGKYKTTLILQRESPANFGTLLSYLYSHRLVIPGLDEDGILDNDMDGTGAKAAAKMLARMYILAHNYEMDGMQDRITRVLEATGLMEKIPGLEFFELAEKLFPDDAEDAADDEFAKHFVKVAPDLIRTVPDKDLPELMRMVSAGGPYAEAIFLAYNTAVKNGFGLATAAPAPAPGEGGVRVKREAEEGVDGEIEEPTAKKARNDRTVSEETAGGDAI